MSVPFMHTFTVKQIFATRIVSDTEKSIAKDLLVVMHILQREEEKRTIQISLLYANEVSTLLAAYFCVVHF